MGGGPIFCEVLYILPRVWDFILSVVVNLGRVSSKVVYDHLIYGSKKSLAVVFGIAEGITGIRKAGLEPLALICKE